MIDDFSATFHARLEEVTSGELFPRRRDGALVSPNVVRSTLSPRPVDYEEGDECPLVRWSLYAGTMERQETIHDIIINALIWTPGTPYDGADAIERLIAACLRVADGRGLAGHRLVYPVTYFFGEQGEHDKDGLQPHPYHQGGVKLRYSAPNRRVICPR